MTRPITFAAVLLCSGLLALCCLPVSSDSACCKYSQVVDDSGLSVAEMDKVSRVILSTSERGLSDAFRPPSAAEYLLWACEELSDALHARTWREAWWQVRSAGWYLRAAWQRFCGRQVCA